MTTEQITIEVATDVARAYREADGEQRRNFDAILETKLRDLTGRTSMTKLPDWCNVYEGMTDDEIDEIERAIVRDPSTRILAE